MVPVGQAVLALRKKIADGAAPGLAKQTDLFADPIGHARPPLAVLVAYCYYAKSTVAARSACRSLPR